MRFHKSTYFSFRTLIQSSLYHTHLQNLPKRCFISNKDSKYFNHIIQRSFSNTKKSPKKDVKDIYIFPKSFSIGTLAGFLGSLAGMGGGFLMIPLMTIKRSLAFSKQIQIKALGVSQHVAHGTSLFAVCSTGLAGGLGFGLQESLHWESVCALAFSGMITARLGALMTTKLSSNQLKAALGVFMICVAPLVPLKSWLHSKDEISEQVEASLKDDEKVYNVQDKIILPGMVGFGSGFISGLFGVGGGAVTVPALTIFTDISHYQALGTSLYAMSLPALAGTITHYQKGNVSMRIAVPLACGAFFGGYTGGKIGSKISEDKLRWGFCILLLSLGTHNLRQAGVLVSKMKMK